MAVFVGHPAVNTSSGGAVTRSWVGNGSMTVSLAADFESALIIIQGNGYTTIWSYGTTSPIVLHPNSTVNNISVSSADGRNFTFSGQTVFIQSPGQSYYAIMFPLA